LCFGVMAGMHDPRAMAARAGPQFRAPCRGARATIAPTADAKSTTLGGNSCCTVSGNDS
jgi:hypothetical protein